MLDHKCLAVLTISQSDFFRFILGMLDHTVTDAVRKAAGSVSSFNSPYTYNSPAYIHSSEGDRFGRSFMSVVGGS